MLAQRHFNDRPDGDVKPYPARHVFLTGFMGSGKTTVGRLLAGMLGRQFLDMDEELERRHHKSIADIFESRGESFFRQAESALLSSLANHDRPLVVATGGGVVELPVNLMILGQALTFFLDLDPETAWERIGAGASGLRPLAVSRDGFRKRWAKRRPLYQKCGRVMEASLPPGQVAELIAEHILEDEPITLSAEGRSSVIRTYAPAGRLPQLASALIGERRAAVLLDPFFRDRESEIRAFLPEAPILYPPAAGEAAKSWEAAGRILEALAALGLGRDDFLVVRGGGSLTDLGAFCAGLYRRGLNLVLMPTTLLAAVDAAIGGKTAVNLAGAKNQAGHFFLPREVWTDPAVLAALPPDLKLEGLTEAFKTGLLFDPELAAMIGSHLGDIQAGDLPMLCEAVHRSATAKCALVARDFREELGMRDVLNLGHTYGHVVESHHGPSVSHGRAVALGLAVALQYSRDRHGFPPAAAKAAAAVCLELAGGEFPEAPPEDEVRRLLAFDKKIRGGSLKFVALSAPGRPVVDRIGPDEIVSAAAKVGRHG